MNPKQVVKGINGILEGGISITDFSIASELDEISAKELLYTLVQNGIGTWNDDLVDFDIPNDRLQTASFAINLGATIEDVSEYLTWRDFESLTGLILEEKDFDVTKNLIMTKPRMEIDVVGKKMDIALLIDCKHWKNVSKSAFHVPMPFWTRVYNSSFALISSNSLTIEKSVRLTPPSSIPLIPFTTSFGFMSDSDQLQLY